MKKFTVEQKRELFHYDESNIPYCVSNGDYSVVLSDDKEANMVCNMINSLIASLNNEKNVDTPWVDDILTLECFKDKILELQRKYESIQDSVVQEDFHFMTWLALQNKVLTFVEVQYEIDTYIGDIKRRRSD